MKIMANRPAPIRAAKPATIPALKLFMTPPVRRSSFLKASDAGVQRVPA